MSVTSSYSLTFTAFKAKQQSCLQSSWRLSGLYAAFGEPWRRISGPEKSLARTFSSFYLLLILLKRCWSIKMDRALCGKERIKLLSLLSLKVQCWHWMALLSNTFDIIQYSHNIYHNMSGLYEIHFRHFNIIRESSYTHNLIVDMLNLF